MGASNVNDPVSLPNREILEQVLDHRARLWPIWSRQPTFVRTVFEKFFALGYCQVATNARDFTEPMYRPVTVKGDIFEFSDHVLRSHLPVQTSMLR